MSERISRLWAAVSDWSARRKALAGAITVLVLAATAWLLWPSPEEPAPRERRYQATTACLLTDDKGIGTDPARTVWAGMQDASLATRVKVQHLSVYGPQTSANALSYFNSLGAQKCTMILAVGKAPVGAMAQGHGQFPAARHVAVGDDIKTGSTGAGSIQTVPAEPPDAIRKTVADLVATIG